MNYRYDSQFFDFVNASSGKSANRFLTEFVRAVLEGALPVSVLDVGCGRGVWLAEWRRQGVTDICGMDGTYVDPQSLRIPVSDFRAMDISKTFDLERKFDWVECMEVAEHIPEQFSDILVDNLVRHGDVILFSAAIPGQGGEFHVNERPYEYWRAKFLQRGYQAYDAIRPSIRGLAEIEPWYRYNTFVFANEAGSHRLSGSAKLHLMPADRPIADLSPLYWRVRCALIAALPGQVTSALARIKHRAANLVR